MSEVRIEAGGRAYTLLFNTRALRLAEREMGRGVPSALMEMQEAPSFTTVCQLLAAGLSCPGADLSLDEVDEIVDEIGLPAAVERLGEAISAAFPDPETAPGNRKARRAKKTTGTTKR